MLKKKAKIKLIIIGATNNATILRKTTLKRNKNDQLLVEIKFLRVLLLVDHHRTQKQTKKRKRAL